MQHFVKIRELIPFGPKCPNLGIWAQNFGNQMSDLKQNVRFEISPFEILYDRQNFVKRLEN